MNQVLLATVSGIIVGALFSYFNFPIPAPPNLAGVMGVAGVYLGSLIIKYLI
ncbi:XapX domain-containing protein [Orenia marismortui]|uniref:XapX domain-containing protein n=1 Tax=Orenia marismortui TaxID=46469 RepID=A0A4R8HQR3_9FIRM|nr:DUF1427 family protein [Orenia marismortui]TDX59143.1 XapX domain-containing protein [Orenia marismortui]